MEMNENKLKEIILNRSKFASVGYDIVDDTNLLFDLGYDSLSIVELMVDIEVEFGVSVDGESLADILVYKDLREKIQKAL